MFRSVPPGALRSLALKVFGIKDLLALDHGPSDGATTKVVFQGHTQRHDRRRKQKWSQVKIVFVSMGTKIDYSIHQLLRGVLGQGISPLREKRALKKSQRGSSLPTCKRSTVKKMRMFDFRWCDHTFNASRREIWGERYCLRGRLTIHSDKWPNMTCLMIISAIGTRRSGATRMRFLEGGSS